MKWRKQITQAVDRHSDRIMDLERFYYGVDNPADQGIDQRLAALENKVSTLMAQAAAVPFREEAEALQADNARLRELLAEGREAVLGWRDMAGWHIWTHGGYVGDAERVKLSRIANWLEATGEGLNHKPSTEAL